MSNAMPVVETEYTYADFLEWDEHIHAEIIDGEFFEMATPLRKHQYISGNLFFFLKAFLLGKPCKVYAAPFSVRLDPRPDKSDTTVLEPDLAVICDSEKLDDKGCNGAPDFVIEILSPSTARNDKLVKFNKYLEAGVTEYWLVYPDEKMGQACLLKGGNYIVSTYGIDEEMPNRDKIPVETLPGCVIDLKDIFTE